MDTNLSVSDLTFIINEPRKTLSDRFCALIKDTRYFDALIAFFNVSGFYKIYKPLETTEKIRILIGISTSHRTYELINIANEKKQLSLKLSHNEVKEHVENKIQQELNESEDSPEVEDGIYKFINWITTKKLEIRAYPSSNLHAKVYIMTFKEGDRDVGRVITGSSNFTAAGLEDNLEFNVELKNRSDYEFAKQRFEELWKVSVDVSEKFVQTIQNKTWLNDTITPYELYLKFLYEYFKDELEIKDELFKRYIPVDFKDLKYQRQAVLNAKKILKEYGGVFISDVVGLGKTYIAAMLINEIGGRTMVIAPPTLLSEKNPGSWVNVFFDFHIPAKFISIGKLDEALREVHFKDYDNIIIDESHRFRNEATIGYQYIAEICRGKKVILVSATPYNNSPKDLLSQIKLFQNARKSSIPGVPNLEGFLGHLQSTLKKTDRQKDYAKYLETVKQNSRLIRDKILKYLMVRRTRKEIEEYFKDDLEKNGIKFPKVEPPRPLFYQLNEKEDRIFMETLKLITQDFKYARYTPLLYLKQGLTAFEAQAQKNLGGFMKVLLLKRLESSFYSFLNTIRRFIRSYNIYINEYINGNVYVSKKYIDLIFQCIEEGDDGKIEELIEQGKATRYDSEQFRPEFLQDLHNDLEILHKIESMWSNIERDPKLYTFFDKLEHDEILRNNKLVVFTESAETAIYLQEKINQKFGEIALLFHGGSPESAKNLVINNFDARAKNQENKYRILVATEVLSEGVNLHRSNVVINYDIPWNPTRIMQRVGRVNRVDTKFDTVYIYNFFPTVQSDSEIELVNIARSKIEAFLTLLGGDAAILTEGEPVSSHELFDKLLSPGFDDDDFENSELKYLKEIEEVKELNPELYTKIKSLPKKARSAKECDKNKKSLVSPDCLLTFFRKGNLKKFFIYGNTFKQPLELDFVSAARILESNPNDPRRNIPLDIYHCLLEANKNAFFYSTAEEGEHPVKISSRDSAARLLKILRATKKLENQLNEYQQSLLEMVIQRVSDGALPTKTIQNTLKELQKLKSEINNPVNVIAVLNKCISPGLLREHQSEPDSKKQEKREVILSMYLTGDQNPEFKASDHHHDHANGISNHTTEYQPRSQ